MKFKVPLANWWSLAPRRDYTNTAFFLVLRRQITPKVGRARELMSGPILRYWQKVEPILEERRKHLDFPDAIDSVKYLAQEMIMIRDKKLASTKKRR